MDNVKGAGNLLANESNEIFTPYQQRSPLFTFGEASDVSTGTGVFVWRSRMKKHKYEDERLCQRKLSLYNPWAENPKDRDPSLDVVLHNTMRFDVHLPHAGAFLEEEDWKHLANQIAKAICEKLPKSYMAPHRLVHDHSAMPHRETIVVSYD